MSFVFFSPARRPADEDARQRAVAESGVFDRRGDETLQAIVVEAAAALAAPMAALSIIDGERQWLVAATGLVVGETSRAVSFCAHTILAPDELLMVPDAGADRRFAGNPFVVGDPAIRFYLGAPLKAEGGHALGALCVLDPSPRSGVRPTESRALRLLAERASQRIASFKDQGGPALERPV